MNGVQIECACCGKKDAEMRLVDGMICYSCYESCRDQLFDMRPKVFGGNHSYVDIEPQGVLKNKTVEEFLRIRAAKQELEPLQETFACTRTICRDLIELDETHGLFRVKVNQAAIHNYNKNDLVISMAMPIEAVASYREIQTFNSADDSDSSFYHYDTSWIELLFNYPGLKSIRFIVPRMTIGLFQSKKKVYGKLVQELMQELDACFHGKQEQTIKLYPRTLHVDIV